MSLGWVTARAVGNSAFAVCDVEFVVDSLRFIKIRYVAKRVSEIL